jgi:hypothetical protein
MIRRALLFAGITLIGGYIGTPTGRSLADDEKAQPFALYLVASEHQNDVWRYSTFLVDLDKLRLEEKPLATGDDIEAFGPTAIRFKKPIALPPQLSATGLWFVIVVNGERELLGDFLPGGSSMSRSPAATMLTVPNEPVKEIRIPEHCKRLNSYLRELRTERGGSQFEANASSDAQTLQRQLSGTRPSQPRVIQGTVGGNRGTSYVFHGMVN